MYKVHVLNESGQVTGELNLPEKVFAYPVKENLLYEAVVNARANQRRGTASTKTRGEVSGGGRKPWRQKGTGRARVGSIRSPLWRKGGTVFGPRPRDYHYELPKQIKKNALKSALSLKFSEKKLLVLEGLRLDKPKTKDSANLLKNLHIDSALIVDTHKNKNLFLSVKNLPKIKAVDWAQLAAPDILNHSWLVFTRSALDSLMEKF